MQQLKKKKKINFIRNSNIPEFIRKLFYPLVLRHRRFETGSDNRNQSFQTVFFFTNTIHLHIYAMYSYLYNPFCWVPWHRSTKFPFGSYNLYRSVGCTFRTISQPRNLVRSDDWSQSWNRRINHVTYIIYTW